MVLGLLPPGKIAFNPKTNPNQNSNPTETIVRIPIRVLGQ